MDRLTWPAAHTKPVIAGVAVAVIGIATAQWIIIGVGLAIGIIARWAYLMSTAQKVGRRDAMIDLMMAPMNGVISANLAESAGLHDGRLLLAAAMCGAGSTLAFVYARKQFNRFGGGLPEGHYPMPPSDAITPRNATGVRHSIPTAASPVAQYGARITPPAAAAGDDPDQDILDAIERTNRAANRKE